MVNDLTASSVAFVPALNNRNGTPKNEKKKVIFKAAQKVFLQFSVVAARSNVCIPNDS